MSSETDAQARSYPDSPKPRTEAQTQETMSTPLTAPEPGVRKIKETYVRERTVKVTFTDGASGVIFPDLASLPLEAGQEGMTSFEVVAGDKNPYLKLLQFGEKKEQQRPQKKGGGGYQRTGAESVAIAVQVAYKLAFDSAPEGRSVEGILMDARKISSHMLETVAQLAPQYSRVLAPFSPTPEQAAQSQQSPKASSAPQSQPAQKPSFKMDALAKAWFTQVCSSKGVGYTKQAETLKGEGTDPILWASENDPSRASEESRREIAQRFQLTPGAARKFDKWDLPGTEHVIARLEAIPYGAKHLSGEIIKHDSWAAFERWAICAFWSAAPEHQGGAA